MSVAELLRDSMAAHEEARRLRNTKRPDKPAARVALLRARDLRRQAIQADPERQDPAWAEEQRKTPTGRDTHEELMAFYAEQLRES